MNAIALMILCCVCLFSACQKTNSNQGTHQQGKKEQIQIYEMNDETLEREAISIPVPKGQEVTASFVVSTVLNTFAQRGIEIGLDKVTEKEDTVIVSFQNKKPPLTDVGSGVEETILDCISMSLLDNVKTCKNVVFQAEGKAYESGHFVFEKDEVYKSLKNKK